MSQHAADANPDRPHEPGLASLQAACAEQMERFRRERANDPTPCLVLFRQAIFRRDPVAWEALIAIYQPHVQRWIRRRGFAADPGQLEELVQEALVRFWRAYTPEQLARAHSLAEILRYWQDCSGSVFLDWLRRGRNAPASLEDADRAPARGDLRPDALQLAWERSEARSRLWQVVAEQCQDKADQIIAHRIFVEGQKPRDLLREYPDDFATIEQIYKRLRNLKDRLRRNPNLLELLAACC